MRPVPSGSWCSRVAVLTFALGVAASAAVVADNVPRSAEWPRLLVSDPITRDAMLNTLEQASRWLGDARCRELFTDFRDEAGRPLERKLTDLQITGQRYLTFVIFRDAGDTEQCRRFRPLAFTEQGSRVVFVCGRDFAKEWKEAPARATAAVIHEALHTLGLGENPPSSLAITQQVLKRCGR